MNGGRDRLSALLTESAGLEGAELEAYLDKTSGGDPALRSWMVERITESRSGGPPMDFSTVRSLGGGVDDWPQPEVGAQLDDFVLIDELGRGGMGIVFRARDLSLDRDVALKLLPSGPSISYESAARFTKEARAAAALTHAGIVPIHRVGQANGWHYFTMKLVNGHDFSRELHLQRELRDGKAAEGLLLPAFEDRSYISAVVRLVRDAAYALAHAHEAGLMHRDIKPSNLLLDAEGVPHIVDFGLVWDRGMGELPAGYRREGTRAYMSPEQASEDGVALDERTDVYSLGAVLLEALTLAGPATHGRDWLSKHPSPREVNPRVPRDLDLVVRAATARKLETRYPRALDLAEDLDRFLNLQAVKPPVLSLSERMRQQLWMARRRIAVALVVLAAVSTAVVGTQWGLAAARDQALGKSISALVAHIDWEAAGEGVWLSDTASKITELRRLLLEAEERGLHEEGAGFPQVQGGRERLAHLASSLEANARRRVDAVKDHDDSGDRRAQLLQARRVVDQVALIIGHEIDLAESLATRVVLSARSDEGQPVPARAEAWRIDPIREEVFAKLDLGPVPCTVDLESGIYRFIVHFEGGGYAEVDRYMRIDVKPEEISVAFRPKDEGNPPGMVRFDRPVWDREVRGPPGTPTLRHRVELESFWLDEAEVTNGDYEEFLRETRTPPPLYWKDLSEENRPSDWATLPVIGVSWRNAQAYAEWAGKRLVWRREWEYAAGGVEGRDYPWTTGLIPREAGANAFEVKREPGAPKPTRFEEYLENVMPVRSAPNARSPEGLFHLFGNVAEITASPVVIRGYQGFTTNEYARLCKGEPWDAADHGWTLETFRKLELLEEGSHKVGFRCARTIIE